MSHSEDFGHSDEEKDESHDDIEAVSEPDNDYYSFLHVPRTATQEEIIAAYKKLSRLYHPDKVCYIIRYLTLYLHTLIRGYRVINSGTYSSCDHYYRDNLLIFWHVPTE